MEHDTDNEDCWCGPDLLQPCPECPVEPGNVRARPDCWRCGGKGLVPAFDTALPLVIVHNSTEDILRALEGL